MTFKNLLPFFAAISIGFIGCTESSEEPGGSGATLNASDISLNRYDISSAKSLLLSGSESRTDYDNLLMMIDADGNMAAVVLECTINQDGASTTLNTIKTHPRDIKNLSKSWMFFYGCQFSCEENQQAARALRDSYGDTFSGVHMLVNKTTGKIYPISQENLDYVYSEYAIFDSYYEDANGVLYSQTHRDGYHTISLNADGTATIKKVGSTSQCYFGDICDFGNGTLGFVTMAGGGYGYGSLTLLYPNNGQEQLVYNPHEAVFSSGTTEFEDLIKFFSVNNGIKVMQLSEEIDYSEPYHSEEGRTQTVTICDLNVGTQFGSWSFSSPIITASKHVEMGWNEHGYRYLHPLWDGSNLNGYFESNNYVFIGEAIAVSKHSGQVTDLTELKENGVEIILPNESNCYNNKAWIVYLDAAQWFDCETLQGGLNYFAVEPNCDIKDNYVNIAAGEVMLTMYCYVDGTTKVATYDIETGQPKTAATTLNTTPNIITLIPLN
ncbi:MAG: hypothetical protein NC301_08285 [Bacteroides sp.]|nr:hypothetical protein [Bacteroides sp.]MCM1379020.1 hypothetical protein [Bacteroides sp.]MCM1445636.1 hypothetical protein [Prevotella sp.]